MAAGAEVAEQIDNHIVPLHTMRGHAFDFESMGLEISITLRLVHSI
jgi:hypothetical protein